MFTTNTCRDLKKKNKPWLGSVEDKDCNPYYIINICRGLDQEAQPDNSEFTKQVNDLLGRLEIAFKELAKSNE